jgi:hypothetical protein
MVGRAQRFTPTTQVYGAGQDDLGAVELPLGIAVLTGLLLCALPFKPRWLGGAALLVMLGSALWYGNLLEYRLLHQVGRRRFRGNLLVAITWVVLGWSLLWAGLLILLAHARGWHWLSGWRDGPLLLTLGLGSFYMSQGVRLGVRRWLCLGGVLLLLGVLIPAVRPLREHMDLAAALLDGGALLASGMAARRALQGRRGRPDANP